MGQLYTPPNGYYDRPFTWIFDGSNLVDASNTLNQSVHVYSGYGDFVMRRAVGFNRVLNNSGGQLQFYDALNRAYEDVPMNVSNPNGKQNGEYPLVPESFYKEGTDIRFDLYKVLRAITGGVSTAHVAFQGSRRKPGSPTSEQSYKLQSLTYSFTTTINQLGGSNILNQAPVRVTGQVMDYAWDLYQVIVSYSSAGGAVPTPATALWIQDSDRQLISNLPVLDIYYNGAPGSTYKQGGIVPPLPFPVFGRLEVDFYSVINNAALLPVTINLSLVGMRRVPC